MHTITDQIMPTDHRHTHLTRKYQGGLGGKELQHLVLLYAACRAPPTPDTPALKAPCGHETPWNDAGVVRIERLAEPR